MSNPNRPFFVGASWKQAHKPRNRRERRKLVAYGMAFGLPIHELVRVTGFNRAKLRQIERGRARAIARLYHERDPYRTFAHYFYGQPAPKEVRIPRRPGWVNPSLGAPYGGRLVENTHQARSYEEFSVRTIQALTTGLGLLYEEVASNTMEVAVSRLREDAMLKALRGWPEESPVERMGRMGREAYERNR